MAALESKITNDTSTNRSSATASGTSNSRNAFSPIRMRPLQRAQTIGDITSPPPIRRRSSFMTNESQGEKISMMSSVDDLLLPTTPTKTHSHASSHFHSTPLLFAVLPALGGILFEGGSIILTDICIIVLACIFLNWSLRLPWDWYHSSQAITTEAEFADHGPQPQNGVIEEEDEDEGIEADIRSSEESKTKSPSPKDQDLTDHKAAIAELNHYQLIALVFCFAGPVLGAWLLHSIREQLSRPSEGLISNFNLGIFVLAAELRPTQHVFKLVQSRILYLQRAAAKNPYATAELDPIAVDDIKTRLSELEAHIANRVESSSTADQRTTAVAELRRSIQPELDALNRAVRRYEKRAIALELQVRAELQDHDQRIKDALSLAAAFSRQKKGSFMTALDFVSAIVVLPAQVVLGMISAAVEVPKMMLSGTYDAMEMTMGGKPAWLFPKRVSATKKRDKDGSTGLRRKRRE